MFIIKSRQILVNSRFAPCLISYRKLIAFLIYFEILKNHIIHGTIVQHAWTFMAILIVMEVFLILITAGTGVIEGVLEICVKDSLLTSPGGSAVTM